MILPSREMGEIPPERLSALQGAAAGQSLLLRTQLRGLGKGSPERMDDSDLKGRKEFYAFQYI